MRQQKEEPPSKPMELSELTLPQLWRLKDCMENPERYDIDPKHKGTTGQIEAVGEAIKSLKIRNNQFAGKIMAMRRTGKGLRHAPKPTKKQVEKQNKNR